MGKLGQGSSVFWEVINKMKGAIDPNFVIAPGRYDPLTAGMH